MPTPNTNTATSSLDEAQKRYDEAKQNWLNASQQRDDAVAGIYSKPDEPGTTYEDFLKGSMPEQPTTAVDPKKEKARAWITNIADAISAVGGIIGAANGANVVPSASLTAANQQRYDKLVQRRDAERDAYNKALMSAQSHAMSMAEAYRRRRQQDDAKLVAQEDAKLNRAKTQYDIAADEYARAYKQNRDVVSDTQHEAYEARQAQQHADSMANNQASIRRQDRSAVESHNNNELKKYRAVAGGKYVPIENYSSFVNSVYNKLISDPTIASELKTIKAQISALEKQGKLDAAEKLMDTVVTRYLSSADENTAKIAKDAAEQSGFYATPDLWSFDDDNKGGEKQNIPGF